MLRKMIPPLLFGLIGCGILLWLGLWQVGRLAEKQAYLAEVEAMIAAPPVPLPATADAGHDRFRAVTLAGAFSGEQVGVLVSRKQIGPGLRPISVFVTDDGRRVLVDRGFLPQEGGLTPPPQGHLALAGNLHWPQETDSFTPAPDAKTGLWFARDVAALAAALQTEPLLVVARDGGAGAEAMPVDTSGIPNDHLQYAITWFSLCAVWAGMTAYLLWRIRRQTV